ncbi:FliI/YscN family ATPase [Bradyrhizobium sp. STM 3557]|uniref:FliI/YscN family ATPase n=1 Tax=Bradyrhizobium sp. STM 3557 TaxID=578920 RepID=UPI00388D8037
MTARDLASRLSSLRSEVRNLQSRPMRGSVLHASGAVLRAALPGARLGELCRLRDHGLEEEILAEVIALDGEEAVMAPIGDMLGLSAGAEVERTGTVLRVPVGDALLGRVLDGLGRPLDGRPLTSCPFRAVRAEPPSPLQRRIINKVLPLGVRAIDGLMTCGEGQRLGIYGEPGGGKSTLLASLARGAQVDVIVVALIGERGREVRDFIERQLDMQTRKRTVLVVATSDRPSIERVKASYAATSIAEEFRDRGMRVLLVMDSVTRFARALREIGLAAGEPPTRRGFPPSVMVELPRLLERAGLSASGSITAFYTVLVEGDGTGDPIAEETRSILDGHIVLSPSLASSGHYPAIDVLASRSRVMDAVTDPSHRTRAARVRELLHVYNEIEFLVQVGEYKRGADPRADAALASVERIRSFLRQGSREVSSLQETQKWLARLTN